MKAGRNEDCVFSLDLDPNRGILIGPQAQVTVYNDFDDRACISNFLNRPLLTLTIYRKMNNAVA